jgi:hypothetical protein
MSTCRPPAADAVALGGKEILAKHDWPTDFDQYEALLQHGLEAGYSARWVEPITDSSLLEIAVDLARQSPGIRVSELCQLLNIEPQLGNQLAELASATGGVEITRDVDAEQ